MGCVGVYRLSKEWHGGGGGGGSEEEHVFSETSVIFVLRIFFPTCLLIKSFRAWQKLHRFWRSFHTLSKFTRLYSRKIC